MKYKVRVHRDKSQDIAEYVLVAHVTADALEDFKRVHEVLHVLQDVEWIELWRGDLCIGRLIVPHEEFLDDEEDEDGENLLA